MTSIIAGRSDGRSGITPSPARRSSAWPASRVSNPTSWTSFSGAGDAADHDQRATGSASPRSFARRSAALSIVKRDNRDRWLGRPGGIDALHASDLFPSDNDLEIPALAPQEFDSLPLDPRLIGFRERRDISAATDLCHFFLDDYRFESAWHRPNDLLEAIRGHWAALTPDFSLFSEWPLPLQLFNVYRARWVGCLWQRAGLRVIPTVGWSDEASFEFAFLGIPSAQIVALSVPDLRSDETRAGFLAGFASMLEQIAPREVLVHGALPDEVEISVPVLEFERWQRLRDLPQAQRRRQPELSDWGSIGASADS